MRANFWIKTWDQGNIGFHRSDIHPALERYWPVEKPGTTVLVPLCGKSQDLLWLEERGLNVIGIEFVESAVIAFFSENKLTWQESIEYGHRCYRANERNICIFVTDFIQWADDYNGLPITALYDRAALVALPKEMRTAYVAACRKTLSLSPRGLLVTLEYESSAMEGPPFSVATEEVEHLWQSQLSLVEQVDMLAEMPRAVAAGVPRLDEYFWVFS